MGKISFLAFGSNQEFQSCRLHRRPGDFNGIIDTSEGSVSPREPWVTCVLPSRRQGDAGTALHPPGKARGHTMKSSLIHFRAEPASLA